MDTKWVGSVVVKIAIWIVQSYYSTYPKPLVLVGLYEPTILQCPSRLGRRSRGVVHDYYSRCLGLVV